MSQQPGGVVDRRLKIENERTESRSLMQQNDRLDVLGVWLLMLFVAVFFGIAAEEANKPSLFATSQNAEIDRKPTPHADGHRVSH